MPVALNSAKKPAPASSSTRAGADRVLPLKLAGRGVVRGARKIFPQWLRTSVVAFIWLGLMAFWVGVTSMRSSYSSGYLVGVSLVLFTAIGCHVWPTRTPPWRTLVFTAILTMWVGAVLLLSGATQYALTISAMCGLLFVLARMNQNARRLWRVARLRPLGDK